MNILVNAPFQKIHVFLRKNNFVVKTANGLNMMSEHERSRGKEDAVCPICEQPEDWLHFAKCCSSSPDKNQFLENIWEDNKIFRR